MTNDRIDLMIYGANGYTGRIITEMAVQRGMRPLLCGRNSLEIQTLASKYNLPHLIADLNQTNELNDAVLLSDVVLHCAGPFVRTYEPMLEACCRNKTHYLDITGEIEVFERIAAANASIKAAGIMAVPGAGFDVVPTDCLAAYLHKKMPSATHLTLAFAGLGGGISHGTASTMWLNMEKGGAVRLNGKIVPVPSIHKKRHIVFNNKPLQAITIPWGDVSTAYYSTGIPNIEVYMAVSDTMLSMMKMSEKMKWLVSKQFFKNMVQKNLIDRLDGPSEKDRKKGKSLVWGEVTDNKGNSASARLVTPEGYTLTALTALAAVERILKGDIKPGFQTPSMAFGADFITTIPGVKREDLNQKTNIVIK